MSHRNDSCPASDLTALTSNFKKVRALNKAPTSLVFLETGALENGSPCSTGYHMYNDATQEMVTTLRSFIVPFLQ
jgi:hypothetical protein